MAQQLSPPHRRQESGRPGTHCPGRAESQETPALPDCVSERPRRVHNSAGMKHSKPARLRGGDGPGRPRTSGCRWEAASNQLLCLSTQTAVALQRRSGPRGWAALSRAAVTCRVQLRVVTPGEGGVSLCLPPFLLRSCNALPEPRNPSILPE